MLVEYDGAAFAGWAMQPGQRSVEADLQTALDTVVRSHRRLVVAGRTDRGVHAHGQVVSYVGPPTRARSLNALLGPDVAVRAVQQVHPGFSARHHALSRVYRYRVLWQPTRSPFERDRALWLAHRELDLEALGCCAAAIVGRHDFTAFTPSQGMHLRFVRRVHGAEWTREGNMLQFRVEADAFMRSMVRVLVGTMLQVATGRRSTSSFVALLAGAPRSQAGVTAPPHALSLEGVRYPDWVDGRGDPWDEPPPVGSAAAAASLTSP